MIRETEEQAVDPRGVRIVGHWLDDALVYCVLDAPDSDAVCQHHAARGVVCEDLHEIAASHDAWHVASHVEALVRQSIASFWSQPA
jgi:hypothetical protein